MAWHLVYHRNNFIFKWEELTGGWRKEDFHNLYSSQNTATVKESRKG